MEEFVLVPTSLYNNKKTSNNQKFTKHELPKYQAEENSTYQTDSLKKETSKKKLFAKAASSADKIFSCPRIKFSNSRTLKLDGVETGVSLSDFAQQLRRNNADVPDIYFPLLDTTGITTTLVLNQNAKSKETQSWIPFKI